MPHLPELLQGFPFSGLLQLSVGRLCATLVFLPAASGLGRSLRPLLVGAAALLWLSRTVGLVLLVFSARLVLG